MLSDPLPCCQITDQPTDQGGDLNRDVNYAQLIQSLQNELTVTEDAVKLAAGSSQQNLLCLPMILWEYDLLNLEQIEQVYKWLAMAYVSPSEVML